MFATPLSMRTFHYPMVVTLMFSLILFFIVSFDTVIVVVTDVDVNIVFIDIVFNPVSDLKNLSWKTCMVSAVIDNPDLDRCDIVELIL